MTAVPSPAPMVLTASYETTRFNALRHGVLSRHTVLPWEDRGEYEALLDAVAAEQAPEGPTEEHLVEELAGIIWRKRRSFKSPVGLTKSNTCKFSKPTDCSRRSSKKNNASN